MPVSYTHLDVYKRQGVKGAAIATVLSQAVSAAWNVNFLMGKDVYKRQDLDGAGRFQKMIYVTLPCIAPTIIIMFIMATGNVIQDDFDQIYNMLNAKVMDVGDVIGTYTYRMGIEKMNFSYATAVGLFKNVVSLILVTFTNAFSRKLSGSSLW